MNETAEHLPVTAEEERFTPDKNAWYDDIDFDVYRWSMGISKHGLDDLNQSPMHYDYRKRHPQPSTDAQEGGSAFHALLLEPESFEQRYALLPPDAPRRPSITQLNAAKPSQSTIAQIDWWRQFDEEHEGITILKAEVWDNIHRMAEAVRANPYAVALVDSGVAERSFWWVDSETKKLCKGRLDWYSDAHNAVVDVKRALDASYTGFATAVARYRYHVQDAMYSDGLWMCDHRIDHFVFLAVEPEPPYGVGIYELDREEKEHGRMEYRRNLYTYAECHDRGEWPGYPPQIRRLQIPRWGFRAHAS